MLAQTLNRDIELREALARPGLIGRVQLPGSVHRGQAQQTREYAALQPAQAGVGDKRSLAQHASVPIRSDTDILGILNVATSAYGRFSERYC